MMSSSRQYLELDQIEKLREACHSRDQRYETSLRDELILVLFSDLRVSELLSLKKSHLKLSQEEIILPEDIQKDYPNGNSPSTAVMRIDPQGHFETKTLLRSYLKSSYYQQYGDEYLFPSRQSTQMTDHQIRRVLKGIAREAEIKPFNVDGGRADPDEIKSHAFRHSVANYMLRNKDNRLIDVRNRLRHQSISTTERIYEHFSRR
jgi:integrase/recombinase XerC/integrase/recombinase XerD